MTESGNVKVLTEDSQFQLELTSAGTKLVVADFFATWYDGFYFACSLDPAFKLCWDHRYLNPFNLIIKIVWWD